MIVHLLLGRSRPNLTEGERAELEGALAALRDVPGVRDLTWGADFSGRSRGYDYAVTMHFTDRDALRAYGTEEAHLRVVAVLDRTLADKLVVDYDTEPSGISR